MVLSDKLGSFAVLISFEGEPQGLERNVMRPEMTSQDHFVIERLGAVAEVANAELDKAQSSYRGSSHGIHA